MRQALYASAGMHGAILLWIVFGESFYRPPPPIPFEETAVVIVSASEFAALTRQPVVAEPTVAPEPVAPTPPPEPVPAPSAPAAEIGPDIVQPVPEAPVAPAVEPQPEVELSPAIAEVVDTVDPVTPPSGAPDLPPEARPIPREAPRVAPAPAPAPEPEAETAPEVIQQATAPEQDPAPVEETPDTAPEEATTQIVTEAEDPAGGPLGPIASIRPTARPQRPVAVAATPDPEPQEAAAPQADPLAAAIASAVADAAAPPAPAAVNVPPISEDIRQSFIAAVRECWNVGSLGTDALDTTVVVSFTMDRGGNPDDVSIRLVRSSGGSDAAVQRAFQAARRAILICGRGGYDLPAESYALWQRVEMTFNPEGMGLR